MMPIFLKLPFPKLLKGRYPSWEWYQLMVQHSKLSKRSSHCGNTTQVLSAHYFCSISLGHWGSLTEALLAQNSLVAQIKYFTPHDHHLGLLSPLFNSNTLMWLKPCFQELACNHSRQECLHIPPRKLRTRTGLQHIWCFPKLLPVPHWKHPGKHNNKQATIRKKGAKNIPNVYYVLKILQISHTVHFTVT